MINNLVCADKGKTLIKKKPLWRNAKRLVVTLMLFFFIIVLISNPKRYIGSVSSGITLYAVYVLPSLFPFFFFTSLLSLSGGADAIVRLFSPITKKLYNMPACSSYIIIMSMLSGYPVGARLVYDFYIQGNINKKEALSIASVASTSGPMFIIGTISAMMLSNVILGYMILSAHFIGSFLNGFLYRTKKEKATALVAYNPRIKLIDNTSSVNVLKDSIYSSIISVLLVGGFIAIFNFILDVMCDIGIINLLNKIIVPVLSFLKIDTAIVEGVSVSFIEITRGISIIAQAKVSEHIKLVFLSALLSLGGLSIIAQNYTYLKSCGIKFTEFLITKTTQCILTAATATVIGIFFL